MTTAPRTPFHSNAWSSATSDPNLRAAFRALQLEYTTGYEQLWADANPYKAKGDLPVGLAAGAGSILAVGDDGSVLTADSTQASGIKWASATATRSSGPWWLATIIPQVPFF